MLQSLPLRPAIGRFLAAGSKGSLGQLLKFRPETVGAAIVWPFQCTAWNGTERLARIEGHFAAVDRLGRPLDFAADEKLVLFDAGEFMEGVRIVLDQPPWFMREGQLTLSLFHRDFRAFSLAFSLWDGPDGLEALIGAVQGRSSPHALALYRDMTKAFQGARPRDLLIELFRMLCRELGVSTIRAVSDACRIHRDPYFGPKKGSQILVDYDEIWEERGGRRLSEAFFELPRESQRAIGDIPAKKRAMYRKRYEMLERMEAVLRAGFRTLRPVRFEES
jgi:uncharacterized protein VirK/YbjX